MELKQNIKIGCIGLGNMGAAIMSGLNKRINKTYLWGYDKDLNKTEILKDHIQITDNLTDMCKNVEILILAVKPNIIPDISKEIRNIIKKDTIIISIAAGVTINTLEEELGKDKKVIRAMPNTPALVSEGMTVLSPNKNITDNELNISIEIFNQLGKTITLPEYNLDSVTAVSGCGPAYGFTVIQAMADAGVKHGLDRNTAVILAAQTLKGSAEMVLNSGDSPMDLRGKVTSPGGSTISAIHVLERAAFSGIIMDAIEAAKKVSQKLGEKIDKF